MRTHILLAISAALLLTLGGCSAETSAEETESGEGAARTDAERSLASTTKVDLEVTDLSQDPRKTIHVSVTDPETVKGIIRLKKTRESARSIAACPTYAANLHFFDAQAKEIGKSQLVCEVGVLDLPDTATIGVESTVDLLAIAKKAPAAP